MKSQAARSERVFDSWYGATLSVSSVQSVSSNGRFIGLWPMPTAPKAEVSTTRLTPASRAARRTRRFPSTAGLTQSSRLDLIARRGRGGAVQDVGAAGDGLGPAASAPRSATTKERRSPGSAPADLQVLAHLGLAGQGAHRGPHPVAPLQQREHAVLGDEARAAGDEDQDRFPCASPCLDEVGETTTDAGRDAECLWCGLLA
jgi:hypothetical protein